MSEDNKCTEVSPLTRPPDNPSICKDLIKNLFGLDVNQIKELNGYDDRNYYVKTCDSNEFILKITNSIESRIIGFLDALNALIIYLDNNGIRVTVPIINNKGKYISYQSFNSNSTVTFAVRLLKFVPGELLYDIPYTSLILDECGALIARVTNALETFDNNYFSKKRRNTWSLLSVLKIRDILIAINDELRKTMILDTLSQFESEVLSHIDNFEHGVIHGDINDQNIIVDRIEDSNEWHVNGLIDFSGANFSPKIFDLAIFLTYAMLGCETMDPLMAPAFAMRGYMRVRKIDENERNILVLCIKARLCQSLAHGAHAYMLDPTNQYVLTTAKNGWTLLKRLHRINHKKLLDKWLDIENTSNI